MRAVGGSRASRVPRAVRACVIARSSAGHVSGPGPLAFCCRAPRWPTSMATRASWALLGGPAQLAVAARTASTQAASSGKPSRVFFATTLPPTPHGELTAVAGGHVDVEAELGLDQGRHTGGTGLVVSGDAVADGDVGHVGSRERGQCVPISNRRAVRPTLSSPDGSEPARSRASRGRGSGSDVRWWRRARSRWDAARTIARRCSPSRRGCGGIGSPPPARTDGDLPVRWGHPRRGAALRPRAPHTRRHADRPR